MFMLPPDLRTAIRAHAALHDMTMSAIAEEALSSYLNPESPTPTQEAQKLLNAIGKALINA
jgi:plasmid stability protein